MVGLTNLGGEETLHYHIVQSTAKRSLNPLDSDLVNNSLHMIQLVGTLVKFNSINSYAAYLAESWNKDESGKVWTFRLRKGLTCEDGTPVDAENYIKGLLLAFRNHAFEHNTPVFSLLRGWGDFYSEKENFIAGLSAPGADAVKFEFESAPAGVELYLSMPYYGFYCPRDFDERGKWKYENQITSSGPYVLKEFDRENDVITLEARKDWPLLENKDAPERIKIYSGTDVSIYKNYRSKTIVGAEMDEDTEIDNGWKIFKGAKIMLGSITLNPDRAPFNDLANRKYVAGLIRKKIRSLKNDFKWHFLSDRFYPFSESAGQETGSRVGFPEKVELKEKLRVIDLIVSNRRTKILKDLIVETCSENSLEFEIVPRPKEKMTHLEGDNWRRKNLDFYITGVDKGGAATVSVVGMMFCSKLGVRYPDPSGRICRLVEKFGGRVLSPEESTRFGRQFEEIVEDDAAVIPVIHRGQNWLYSNDLDLSAMTPNMTFPDLRLVKVK